MKTKLRKMNIFVSALLFLAMTLGMAMPMQNARAADLCVNKDGVTCPYTTIQAAITAASVGDTITVAAGKYVENVTVNKDITITGAGAGTTSIVATTGNTTPLTFSVSGATVSGFTLTHEYTPAELDAWTFNNNGVIFQSGSGNTLEDCTVTLNRNGIYLNNSQNNVIDGNLITNNRTGINFNNNVSGLTITNNTISDNWTLGIVGYGPGTDFSTVNISYNTFSNNWYTEILVKDSTGTGTLNLGSNTFTDSPKTFSNSADPSLNEPGFAAQKPVALGGSAVKPAFEYPTIRIYNSSTVSLTLPATTYMVGPDQSIQTAINAAADCDTILVAPGTYNVDATILLNKCITISGPTGGGAKVVGTGVDMFKVFAITSGSVTLQNLEITLATTPAYPLLVGDELNSSLVSIPSGAGMTGIVIQNNTIYVPAQTPPMTGWTARAITVGGNTVSGMSITGNTIYNTRNGIVIQYNNSMTISNNIIYNTKGGIMNYTGSQADANNRIMSNNSWTTAHNEWDIVWNSGGGPYEPDYNQSVLVLSGANNNAYVVSLMTTGVYANLIGNRSHVWVNTLTGTTTKHPANGNKNLPYGTIALGEEAMVAGGTLFIYPEPVPPLPSNFYGFVYTSAGSPAVGQKVDAYVAGVTTPTEATIILDLDTGFLAYQMDIPGNLDVTTAKEGGAEGDLITFKINDVVVGTGYWHSGTNVELNFAGVTLSALSQAYDGSAKPVTVVTAPVGLAVGITYDGSAIVPINAGSYAVVATITAPKYAGSASGTLVISQATSSVTVTCTSPQTYTGSPITPCTASYSTSDGLTGPLTVNYTNNTNVGTKTASATYAGDANHIGSSNSATFVIQPAAATILLSNLTPVYDGTAKSPTVVTIPAPLAYDITYNGLTTAPSAPGAYTIVVTINDPNGSGTVTDTMYIQTTYPITLVPGWNLVSFPLVPLDTLTGTVLSNISGKYDLVYGWDGSVSINNWLKYAPSIPYGNSLVNLDHKMGFWIHMNVGATLNIAGYAPATTNITLSNVGGGWNLVGFPSSVAVLPVVPNLPSALGTHGVSNFTLVYAYHASDTTDVWKIYDIAAPSFANDLKSLTNGWGYWVKVGSIQTWHVEY